MGFKQEHGLIRCIFDLALGSFERQLLIHVFALTDHWAAVCGKNLRPQNNLLGVPAGGEGVDSAGAIQS